MRKPPVAVATCTVAGPPDHNRVSRPVTPRVTGFAPTSGRGSAIARHTSPIVGGAGNTDARNTVGSSSSTSGTHTRVVESTRPSSEYATTTYVQPNTGAPGPVAALHAPPRFPSPSTGSFVDS